MTCIEGNRLQEWLDGELSAEEAAAVRAHAETCVACAAELASQRALRETISMLPRDVDPDLDLWPAIAARLGERETRGGRLGWRTPAWSVAGYAWRFSMVAAAAVLLVVAVRAWRPAGGAGAAWEVTALAGSPVIDTRDVTGVERLRRGEWLRTDAQSRARLSVADVGRVEVGPKSALRLLGAGKREHRIELAEGRVSAFIWAPPRLFFVETPAGVAEDLGCQYDLTIDPSGNGALDVTLGFVSFERGKSEVIVPDGSRCELRARTGPGTPHALTASPELCAALARFDFEGGDHADLDLVLDAATASDAVTLWHLLPRVATAERGRVFDRLADFVSPPPTVTRDAIVALERRALESWWTAIYPDWTLWN